MANIKPREVITGFIVLVVLVFGLILIFKYRTKLQQTAAPIATPTITQRIQDKLKNFNIPVDREKKELSDVTGGNSMGVETSTEVIADLPDLPNGQFYQVWQDSNGTLVSLGKMKMAKGGYIYEGNLQNKKVVVSREKIFDNKLEVKILE